MAEARRRAARVDVQHLEVTDGDSEPFGGKVRAQLGCHGRADLDGADRCTAARRSLVACPVPGPTSRISGSAGSRSKSASNRPRGTWAAPCRRSRRPGRTRPFRRSVGSRRNPRAGGIGSGDAGGFVYRRRIENRVRHRNTLPSSVEAWTTAPHFQRQPVVRAGSCSSVWRSSVSRSRRSSRSCRSWRPLSRARCSTSASRPVAARAGRGGRCIPDGGWTRVTASFPTGWWTRRTASFPTGRRSRCSTRRCRRWASSTRISSMPCVGTATRAEADGVGFGSTAVGGRPSISSSCGRTPSSSTVRRKRPRGGCPLRRRLLTCR